MSESLYAGMRELRFQTEDEAIEKAIEKVDQARKDQLPFLKTRNEEFNHIVGKGFDISEGQVVLFFSPPNHGKSTKARQLKDDFTNPILNGTLTEKIILVHSLYEGKPFQEILRSVSEETERSFNYLLSAEYQSEVKHYNSVNDDGYNAISEIARKRKGLPIFYVPMSSSPEMIKRKFEAIKKRFPEHMLIWILDHYLLSFAPETERNDVAGLVRSTARTARELKSEFNVLSIILGQTNNDVYKIERKEKAIGHYLKLDDIYFGGEVVQACDVVIGFYQPQLFQIEFFGTEKIYTGIVGVDIDEVTKQPIRFNRGESGYLYSNGLIPNQVLKGRNSGVGVYYESNRLDISTMKPMDNAELEFRKQVFDSIKKKK